MLNSDELAATQFKTLPAVLTCLIPLKMFPVSIRKETLWAPCPSGRDKQDKNLSLRQPVQPYFLPIVQAGLSLTPFR